MATSTVTFVNKFRAGLDLLRGSKAGCFIDKVRNESENHSENGFYDQIFDNLMVDKITTRKGLTPDTEIQYDRRKCTREDYEIGHTEAREDKLKSLNDPRNSIIMSFHRGFMRSDSMRIIEGALGPAWTGKTGTTEVPFPASQVVDITLGKETAHSTAGLTEEKLIRMKEMFGLMEMENDERPYLALTQAQITNMLNDEHFINSDFAGNFQALRDGKATEVGWMGFTWVVSELVPFMGSDSKPVFEWGKANIDGTPNTLGRYIRPIDRDATGIRACFAWIKDGVLFERNPNKIVKIGESVDERFANKIYMAEECGSTRMEEEKVIMCPCDEDPS